MKSAHLDCYCEFVEASIHQILFTRGVYSSELFDRTRLYNLAVHRARHPRLCGYIRECITTLKEGIASHDITQVAVVIQHKGNVVERWVFEISDANIDGLGGDGDDDHSDIKKLLDNFRTLILRLQHADHGLQALPEDCTFEIVAYARTLHEEGSFSHPQWLSDGDLGLSREHESRAAELAQNRAYTLVPVRGFKQETISCQVYGETSLVTPSL